MPWIIGAEPIEEVDRLGPAALAAPVLLGPLARPDREWPPSRARFARVSRGLNAGLSAWRRSAVSNASQGRRQPSSRGRLLPMMKRGQIIRRTVGAVPRRRITHPDQRRRRKRRAEGDSALHLFGLYATQSRLFLRRSLNRVPIGCFGSDGDTSHQGPVSPFGERTFQGDVPGAAVAVGGRGHQGIGTFRSARAGIPQRFPPASEAGSRRLTQALIRRIGRREATRVSQPQLMAVRLRLTTDSLGLATMRLGACRGRGRSVPRTGRGVVTHSADLERTAAVLGLFVGRFHRRMDPAGERGSVGVVAVVVFTAR